MHIYAKSNREERNLCAHLFRLLLSDHPTYRPLQEFTDNKDLTEPRIFSEVALIRDAYYIRKPHVNDFLDELCQIIASQESIADYRLFSELPAVLRADSKINTAKVS